MTVQLTAIATPPRPPSAADHLGGFLLAVGATVVGAILTPFLAVAWVAVQPALPLVAALSSRRAAPATPPASASRAA